MDRKVSFWTTFPIHDTIKSEVISNLFEKAYPIMIIISIKKHLVSWSQKLKTCMATNSFPK